MSFIQITIYGRLGADPKMGGDAKPFCRFSLAVDQWDRQTRANTTIWWNVVAFDRTAELAYQYLKKGHAVLITGTPQQSKYTGKDGLEHLSISVIANTLTFGGGKNDGIKEEQRSPPPQPQQKPAEPYETYETCPF